MDTSGTITEGGKATCTLDKFRQPRILSMADASAIENTKRLSLGPVEITQVRFIVMKLI